MRIFRETTSGRAAAQMTHESRLESLSARSRRLAAEIERQVRRGESLMEGVKALLDRLDTMALTLKELKRR